MHNVLLIGTNWTTVIVTELFFLPSHLAPPQRDLELEHAVLQWIMTIVHEKPTDDYDTFIQDGSILSKVRFIWRRSRRSGEEVAGNNNWD